MIIDAHNDDARMTNVASTGAHYLRHKLLEARQVVLYHVWASVPSLPSRRSKKRVYLKTTGYYLRGYPKSLVRTPQNGCGYPERGYIDVDGCFCYGEVD